MVSKVEICNIALQNLGAKSIASLSEGTPESTACNIRYDMVRRAVLESHPWNFAIKRAQLTLSSTAPAFGYTNAFTLPPDFVRIVATAEQLDHITFAPSFNGYLTISYQQAFAKADDYKIEIHTTGDRVLLSDDSTKKILYVYDNETTGLFPPLFIEMLAKGLSAAIAYRVTGNKSLAQAEQQEFEDMMRKSQTIDAQQGTYERKDISAFVTVRD